MKLLIVGSGGREHALAWKLAQSASVTEITCAPGNGGIVDQADCLNVPASDLDSLVAFAQAESIDLTVVGPETPLIAGLVDRLQAAGQKAFGPTAAAARLEGSKSFAKDLMRRAGIPTARCEVFDDAGAAERYARALGGPCVVKADGEAAGKGALVCEGVEDAVAACRSMLVDRQFGEGGARILVEERMEGPEFSCMLLIDGETFLSLPSAKDHKRAFDGDSGPNTGGMGAFSPVGFVSPDVEEAVIERVVRPLLRTLVDEGIYYRGLLYPGLMLTDAGPKVVEFNCRFGDPETECVIPRLETDLLELLQATAEGRLAEARPRWRPDACATVVMASAGYPSAPGEKGCAIHGLEDAEAEPGVMVFHAGTTLNLGGAEGRVPASSPVVVTSGGGRVLAVTAIGADVRTAAARAYAAVGCITFNGARWRRDIGTST